MPEIIYHFPGKEAKKPRSDIRWLSVNDLNIFNEHLSLCGQRSLDQSTWDEIYDQFSGIYDEGTQYCVLFVDSVPAARACVEKYSADAWEVADVRVARPFRNRGLAFDVCSCVLQYITAEPVTIEELAYLCRMPIAQLMPILSMLELYGLVQQMIGRKYIRIG